jgi:hypothetical protein
MKPFIDIRRFKLGTFQAHPDARQHRESSGVAHVELVAQNTLIIVNILLLFLLLFL